jgi:hypothetical protein
MASRFFMFKRPWRVQPRATPKKCNFSTRGNEWGEHPIKFKPAKFQGDVATFYGIAANLAKAIQKIQMGLPST